MSQKRYLLNMMIALEMAAANFGAAPATKPAAATGRLHLTFTERSALTAEDELRRRTALTPWIGGREIPEYQTVSQSFEVFVPAAYRAGTPHALLVWVGVTEFSPEWFGVLDRHKLILISPNIDKVDPVLRVRLALDAVHNMSRTYNVDEKRIYVSGFSLGGEMAIKILCAFPEVFRGAFILMGAPFNVTYQSANDNFEPTALTGAWDGLLDEIKPNVRLVIMQGENDTTWRAKQARADCEGLLLDGFMHVSYFEVPRWGHNHPRVEWFEKGIVALDQAKPRTAPATNPTRDTHPAPGQIAQAQRILATARMYMDRQPPRDRPEEVVQRMSDLCLSIARKYMQQVQDDFPTTPAAKTARELQRKFENPTTTRGAVQQ
jgi:dienelactone hydrolase